MPDAIRDRAAGEQHGTSNSLKFNCVGPLIEAKLFPKARNFFVIACLSRPRSCIDRTTDGENTKQTPLTLRQSKLYHLFSSPLVTRYLIHSYEVLHEVLALALKVIE